MNSSCALFLLPCDGFRRVCAMMPPQGGTAVKKLLALALEYGIWRKNI